MAILRAEGGLPDASLRGLEALINEVKGCELLDLQEAYVDLFDRTPSLSLHLFEHVHGDARERGQALADLLGKYQHSGLVIQNKEMPDYLPLFLEYLSTLSGKDMQEYLGATITIVAAIEERLRKRATPYAAVFTALRDIALHKPDLKQLDAALGDASGAPLNAEEIDKAWEEHYAFGAAGSMAGQADCPKASAMLARMQAESLKQRA